ncbi:hypothetical protein GCM10010401_13950 [Rarobacter faecitabidus]|uniref:Cro/C1-type helix-turn-helix DNA-binding protein n=1 Tax=Rarobacter faecitabidus TaxID=13243 RepID=A0A542ZE09_RARFA|nr:helix-turn-helix transcriptional regulator [Rarobacter faecitabidus]TQL58558.1 Cro/C1-type helix-turn-helix DNA-binding protein [Rarobacter faecitabidus]
MANAIDALDRVVEPIQTYMREQGYSINSLASETRIPYASLRRRLLDPEQLTFKDLSRIADALHVTAVDVLPQPTKQHALADGRLAG